MDKIYLAHGGKEAVVGGKVTFLEGASISGGIIDNVPDSTAANLAALKHDFNALLKAIRDAGLMRPAAETTKPSSEAGVSAAQLDKQTFPPDEETVSPDEEVEPLDEETTPPDKEIKPPARTERHNTG